MKPVRALTLVFAAASAGAQNRAALPVLPTPAQRGISAAVERSSGRLAAVSAGPASRLAIGSTIKPFTLLAAWRAGILKPETRIACKNTSGRFRCSHTRTGASFSADDALRYSCNGFTLAVGQRIPPAIFRSTLAAMGLRPPAGAQLTDEDLLGLTTEATPEELARAYQRWLASDAPEFLRRGIDRGKTGTAGRHAWFATATPRHVLAVAVWQGTGVGDAAPEAARALAALDKIYRVEYRRRIAQIDEDKYVGMALAGEAGTRREPAYLDSLAVVFRTLARGRKGRHEAEGFDFCSTTHCLALAPEHPALKGAVRRSRHRRIEFGGAPAEAYFTANCGGVRESASAVWPQEKAPYLAGGPDARCQPEQWERRISLAELGRALPRTAVLHDIRVTRRTATGRAEKLLINGSVEMRAADFRANAGRALGWGLLKSRWFDFKVEGPQVIVTGRGAGHGVGLCQAGAARMAGEGAGYREILAYYFPGTAVKIDWAALGAELSLDGRVPKIVEHPTTEEFIRATGRSGWAAAATRRGHIHMQPAAQLEKKGTLESALRHELVHSAVTRPGPAWLEEGAAIHLAGEGARYPRPAGLPEAEIERRLRAPATQEELRSAYAEAYWRVRNLIAQKGERAIRQMLGLPVGPE